MRLTVFTVCCAASMHTACADALAPVPAPSPPQEAIPPGPYVPGQSYFGRNNYIEYLAGNAPVILSAPHGAVSRQRRYLTVPRARAAARRQRQPT